MSDIMCKFRLNNEELPNITALVSKLDGKGRNEIIRLFMRLALNNISYPLEPVMDFNRVISDYVSLELHIQICMNT